MHIGIGIHMGSSGKAAAGGAGVSSPVTGFVQSGADDAAVGSASWTNPGNVTADDGSYTTATGGNGGQATHYLVGTNPDREDVPVGATIDGIVVNVQLKSANAGTQSVVSAISIVKGGAIGAQSRVGDAAQLIGQSDEVKTYGSSSQLWGETWTAADVNASNFGVALNVILDDAGNEVLDTVSVDYIEISVYFTA